MHHLRQREGYIEMLQKLLPTLTPAERVEGMAPEDRFTGMAPEEQILALSDEVLHGFPDDYVRSLPAHVQHVIRTRLSGAHGRHHDTAEHRVEERSTTQGEGREGNETTQRLMQTLTPAERLIGLTPAERLTGLAPEEQILALSDEVLREFPADYVRSLPVHVQEVIRERLATPGRRNRVEHAPLEISTGQDTGRHEKDEEIIQEFLEMLEPEELLAVLEPEERLIDLEPEEQILALSREVLRGLSEEYVRTLPAHVQEIIRERLGTSR